MGAVVGWWGISLGVQVSEVYEVLGRGGDLYTPSRWIIVVQAANVGSNDSMYERGSVLLWLAYWMG